MRKFETITDVRETICKTGIIILVIITIPSLLASLLRIFCIGWQPIMWLHLICVSIVMVVGILRNRLSYSTRAGSIVLLVFIVGVGELLQFGVLGAGGSYLTHASIIAAILFSRKSSILIFSLSSLTILAGYFAFKSDITGIQNIDIYAYAKDWSSWGNFYFDYLLIWASTIATFYYIASALISSIRGLEDKVAQRTHELEKMAITDPLTGLYNRTRIDYEFNLEIEKAKAFETLFSIIMIDIDKFKDINDNFGHLTGDTVLVEFAQILHSTCRKPDIIGRWGGEEFIIICPQTNAEDTGVLAEKLRNNISAHCFAEAHHITASFGITEYINLDEVDTIMKRADEALYRAKNNGRNRVEFMV